MSRLRKNPGLLLLPVFVVSVAGTGCARKSKPPPPPPPPVVEVTSVVQRDEPIYQNWVGTLDGFVNAQIRAQVTGYLLRQTYIEGTSVKKGDLLFEIDPRPFQAAYEQVKAAFDKAELDLKRTSVLTKEDAASLQDRDNALLADEAAKAALDASKLNLEFTRITSPIDGIAGLATAQIGDLVGPNSGILTTVSTVDPIKCYFSITEEQYLALRDPRTGQPSFPRGLQLVLADGRIDPHVGRVFSMDRQIDPNTGTLRVVALFPNPDLLLRPGQYGRVHAIVRIAKNALLVPQRAISELQGGYQATIVDAQNKAHVRTVTVGDQVGDLWIVEDGLHPGDRIVVEGAQKARDGATVNPQPYAPQRPGANGTQPSGDGAGEAK